MLIKSSEYNFSHSFRISQICSVTKFISLILINGNEIIQKILIQDHPVNNKYSQNIFNLEIEFST
jgi:hypothetical protein